MKVHVDASKCAGYGACAEACPSVFEIDEFGFAAVKTESGLVPEEDVASARIAVTGCPESAISAEE